MKIVLILDGIIWNGLQAKKTLDDLSKVGGMNYIKIILDTNPNF